MPKDEFGRILERFVSYRDRIEFLTLHGCAEPLLDRELPEKVAIAKRMGFRGTGFATNCTHLGEAKARALLEAGLDTLICSVDGLTKKTHEAIRVGTDFDEVVANVMGFLRLRQEVGHTRVIVRFIRQEANRAEWPEFHKLWSARLDPARGDEVTVFDIHNWGSKLENYRAADLNRDRENPAAVCQDVFQRMFIYSNGNVALCCADDNGFFDLGNVIEGDPIEIFNGPIFTRYREMMKQGRMAELHYCNACTIPRSRALKRTER